MKTFLQKYGIDLAALILFVVLAFAYCKPVLSGMTLQSGDDINAQSAVQESVNYAKQTGDHSWWSGSMFSGMPNYQIGGGQYHSDKILGPFYALFRKGGSNPAWVLIFYFVCFYLLLRSFNVRGWLAVVGAIAIALSSYFLVIIGAGHGGKTMAIAFISAVAAGFRLIYQKHYLAGAICVILFIAMGLTPHPQMAYYIFMMIGLFFLAEVVIHAREKRWKDLGIATAVFLVALGIGLGTCGGNVFATREYARETMRGGHSDLVSADQAGEQSSGLSLDYATQWSYGLDETFSFLIPGIKGGSSNHPLSPKSHTYQSLRQLGVSPKNAIDFCSAVPLYWGDQPFTAGNVYMGAIVCFLFLLGCFLVKGPYKWALIAATVFSVLLAWGSNFMWLTELFFKYVPLYNKFRAVSSILIVAEIAMPLLGFLALKDIFSGKVEKEKLRRSLWLAGGITGAICLFFALFGRSLYDFAGPSDATYFSQMPEALTDAILADRAALLVGDAWRSLLFIALSFGVLYLFNEKKIQPVWVIAVLGVLVIADMWPVDKRYFNDSFFHRPSSTKMLFAEQPWETAILQDDDPNFRVFNLSTDTFNEARTSYRFKSIGGYCAAKLRRYQDLIDAHLRYYHMPVINMLNAKYFVVPGDNGPRVTRNTDAMGNAWFVGRLKVVDGGLAESEALNEIDLNDTAVLDAQFASFAENPEPGIAPDAEVHLTSYRPNQLEYDCTSSQPGTIVFSEIYYPYGWKASIDGQPVDHFRVNYLLRALNVPAGSHHIRFVFDPDSVRKGDTLATVCVVILYLLMLAAIGLGVSHSLRQRKNEAATH